MMNTSNTEYNKTSDNETLLKDAVCEHCKWLYAGKSDDGRFYRCTNDETVNFIHRIQPDFGCKFFEKNDSD
jgi:hypothetical protein